MISIKARAAPAGYAGGMAYELQLVVTDSEGVRITHPLGCRLAEAEEVARRVLAAIEAASLEIWLGDQRVYAYASAPAYALAA